MTLGSIVEALQPEHYKTNADGTVTVDKTSLEQLGSRLAVVRAQKSALEKEEKELRKAILVHPRSVVGFVNSYVEIGSAQILDIKSALLEKTLRDCGRWEDALDIKVSSKKVREIAKEVPAVDAVLRFDTERRVKLAGADDE